MEDSYYGFGVDEWPGNSVALIGPLEVSHPSHPRWAIEHHGARIQFNDEALSELYDILTVVYKGYGRFDDAE